MARRLILLLALLLAACGQDGGREPFVDTRAPPGLSPRFSPPEGWAWGLVQAGDFPAQRYGVSAPSTGPTAHILILPGYGESAEAWFETAGDLNARGYIVWVLDGAGQGGSGRFSDQRDVGDIPSLEPDLLGIKTMLRLVIPQDGRPVIVLGQQSGAVAAILAARRGFTGDGLILSAPQVPEAPKPYDAALAKLRLGWLRDPGEPGWKREAPYRIGPAGADRFRAANLQSWQIANPDLRMAGPSIGRRLVMSQGYDAAALDLPTLTLSTLLIGGPAGMRSGCAKAAACKAVALPAGARGAYSHLEADAPRNAWLADLDGFVARIRESRLTR